MAIFLTPDKRRRIALARKRQEQRWRGRNGPVLRSQILPATAQSPPDAQHNTSGDGPMSGTALAPASAAAVGYE